MLEVAASTVTDGTVRMKSPGMPNLSDVSPAELDNYMRRLFKIGDRDGNGSLDKIELQDLLKKSGFNLSFDTIGQMMKTADTNGDGLIQFDEFVRAVAYLQNGDEGFPTPAAPGMPNLADVPAAQLSRYMAKLFQIGDTNGDGVLDADELESLLKKSGFNLSSEIIATLMQKADINGDGVISETEFCAAGVALQQVGFPVEQPAAPPMPDLADVEPAQLMRYMERLFKIGDKNNDDVLDALELRDLLQKSGFNLDQQTIATVMDAVDVNRDGVIQFSEFCHAISILIKTMSQEEENVMPDIKSVNKLELRSYFMRLFKIADTNGDGVLQPAEMEALLRKSGFGFDSATIQEMVRLADANGDGVIEYNEFVPAMMAVAQFSRHVPEVRADMPKISSVPPAQLELYFQKLFSVGDKDKNGVLDAIEFRDLLRASGFGFDDATISKILREADTNNDGVLQFDEFLVAMSRLVAQLPRPI
jgi:Ca2+-binding EF-hand superfamily protein